MQLSDIVAGIEGCPAVTKLIDITGVAFFPWVIKPGFLFAKTGRAAAIDRAVARAIENGAVAILFPDTDQEAEAVAERVEVLRVSDVDRAYALACAAFYGHPARSLTLIGVTGTKGKTTTCHLIDAVLRDAGLRTGLISSAVTRTPTAEYESAITTPEPRMLHSLLKRMLQEGATHVTIEVSSIGLAEERLRGIPFSTVVFTNLGTEHFEYHGGREAYLNVKMRLFSDPALHASPLTRCVINADDPAGAEIAGAAAGRVITYGLKGGDVRPERLEVGPLQTEIWLPDNDCPIVSPLLGEHNAYNILAAYAGTRDIANVRQVADAVAAVDAIPGRFVRIKSETLAVEVIVDYAHTPESVVAALRTAALIAAGRRVVAVLGCAGESDQGKRPLMARAARDNSDVCVITSDNPRFEDAEVIIRDMLAGLESASGRDGVEVISDRRMAIDAAVRLAAPDGVVVILGRGDERFQSIAGREIPLRDSDVAREALQRLEGLTR